MADTASVRGVALRDFNDAGTGESFVEGKEYDFEPGVHENYATAGLISDREPVAIEQVLGAAPADA